MNDLPSLSLKPGENLFDAYHRQGDAISVPWVDKTAMAVEGRYINPTISDRVSAFGQALKIANQEVVQRLDKLIDSMAGVARTPRNLTVQTPNPVDDAAKILGDMQRGSMAAAGL